MNLVTDNRASRILYNYLATNQFAKPFLIPVNVCGIIPPVFAEAGVPVEYVDIDKITLCLDLEQFTSVLDLYSGVLFVHTYGTERGFEEEFKRIKHIDPNFQIIDDKCLCVPYWDCGDTYADIQLYSVGERKQVDCGRGGFAFIKDGIPYDSRPLVKDSVLDDSQWALDFDVLKERIDVSRHHKKRLNAIYQKRLPGRIQLDEEFQNWRFNILVDNKDVILKELFENGLFASSHYSPLMPMTGTAEALQKRVINLFNDFYFTEEMAQKACDIILRYL